jgi:hypothetical protein
MTTTDVLFLFLIAFIFFILCVNAGLRRIAEAIKDNRPSVKVDIHNHYEDEGGGDEWKKLLKD